jgi:glycerophosphoryl diester phosphodiesterase
MTTADDILIQAHRGAGNLAPENTLGAFELAWQLSCVPEADVQTSHDGAIVAFHDDDVPSDAPRMTDVFALMHGQPNRRLYLDIKNVDLPQLAGEVRQYHVEKQIILASTKYDIIRKWKSLVPESSTLLWMGGSESELNKRFEELRKSNFADITQLQIHTHLLKDASEITRDSSNPFTESDAFLIARGEEIRAHGILYQALPYGGSTPGVYAKLLDLGVMSFATDHPDAARDAVRKYYEARD